ncbi:hypothetical protein BJX76DRAFT_360021 [Aspergillus varians]
MAIYVHCFSTPTLDHALSPFRRQPLDTPEAPNDDLTQTPSSQRTQISAGEYAEVHRLFCELFPPWWQAPSPGWEREVAALREDAHKRCRPRNLSCLEKIHQFFLELRPLVSYLMPDEEPLRLGGSEQQEDSHESMDLDPRPQTQTVAHAEEMDVDNDTEMERDE